MIPKTKHCTTNYKAVKPFLDFVDTHEGHYHFESEGYMDFVVEKLYYTDHAGNDVYSISHYGEQNGDLMADPDMMIAVDRENGRIIPHTFRNDYIHTYQEVFKTIDGKLMYSHRLLIDLDEFLYMWLNNIKEQGFKAA